MNKNDKLRQISRLLKMTTEKVTLSEDEAAEVPDLFPPWEPGKNYPAGKRLKHGTKPDGSARLYEVKKAHDSTADAPPDKASNLYKELKKGA